MHTLKLPLPPKAKQRPYVTNGGKSVFYRNGYSEWKEDAIFYFKQQWGHKPTIEKTELVELFLKGGRSNADPDQLAGGILDALVQAGVLIDDSVRIIKKLRVDWEPSKKGDELCTIIIKEAI